MGGSGTEALAELDFNGQLPSFNGQTTTAAYFEDISSGSVEGIRNYYFVE
jgi:hypothetical protein